MAKRIVILGSTGSIGRKSLQVIDGLGGSYKVVGLSAHSNVELLAEQVRRYKPGFAAVTNEKCAEQFRKLTSGLNVEILTGANGLVEMAGLENADIVLVAVVGVAGLRAVLEATRKAKRLAIANKEPLVVAGRLVMKAARESGAMVLPVDSEHSAIFQAMQAGSPQQVSRIILTTSGGPFRTARPEDLKNVTIEQALSHPVWDMGPKITIDSATMVNKALEVIEARWLFDVPVEKIKVLVHPESIVHSLVEFVDGSVIAQLGTPDMALPIQYALTYPDRQAGICEHLELEKLGQLNFSAPDFRIFPALQLGFEVAKASGADAAVFNAANEKAVAEFLEGRIKFGRIYQLIEHCLKKHNFKTCGSIDELLKADTWAKNEVAECLRQRIC